MDHFNSNLKEDLPEVMCELLGRKETSDHQECRKGMTRKTKQDAKKACHG